MYQSRRTNVIRELLFALTLLVLLAGAAYSPSNTIYSVSPNSDNSALPSCHCGDNGISPIPCYDYGGACGCAGKICQ